MKYKLIAIDMDGTLLTDDKEVTQHTINTIKRANDIGVKVAICTGRLFTSAKYYANIIGTKVPIIASNGSYIRDKDNGNIIYQKNLKADELKEIIELTKNQGFYPHLFTSDTTYSQKLINSSKNYTKWNEKMDDKEKVKIEIVDNLLEVVDEISKDVLKVIVISDEIDKLMNLKIYMKNMMKYSIVSSWKNNFEITSLGISKGSGVKTLGDYYGISSSETICIGDSENDSSMIEYAGLGIAMGNGDEEVKKIAKYVTDTNNNDGVAKAIEKFVLN